MKKSIILLLIISILVTVFSSCSKKNEEEIELSPSEINGVWIASVYNINFPSKTDLSKLELQSELDSIIDKVCEIGLNTIFFQVRGAGDSLYSSNLFPVSTSLSTNGELTLDCLEYLINAAHKKNIYVHAWVNPLRAALSEDTESQYSELTIPYNGIQYFDCGIPEVRELVVNGVREIIQNYDIDGIVFDDYFYPYPDSNGTQFDDDKTYSKYAKNDISKEDWRRDNINQMIKAVYNEIKAYDSKIQFGVSPFGIWKNGTGNEDGSLTYGLESYSTLYCDTIAWINGGYVDYISPQLYWDDTFQTLAKWWQDRVAETDVKLVISHAAYRYDNDWEDPQGIIERQVSYSKELLNYNGNVFYGYKAIKENINDIATEIKEIYTEPKK